MNKSEFKKKQVQGTHHLEGIEGGTNQDIDRKQVSGDTHKLEGAEGW